MSCSAILHESHQGDEVGYDVVVLQVLVERHAPLLEVQHGVVDLDALHLGRLKTDMRKHILSVNICNAVSCKNARKPHNTRPTVSGAAHQVQAEEHGQQLWGSIPRQREKQLRQGLHTEPRCTTQEVRGDIGHRLHESGQRLGLRQDPTMIAKERKSFNASAAHLRPGPAEAGHMHHTKTYV